MKFITPPENQGQIVEVSYGAHEEGVVMRVTDHSDRSDYYRLAHWTEKLGRWWDSRGPQNEEPPYGRFGKKLTPTQIQRIVFADESRYD